MRLILVLLFTSITLFCAAQKHIAPYQLNDKGVLYYDQIVEDPTLTLNDYFTRSKSWIATAFRDGKEVDMYSDKAEGIIVGKGSVKVKSAMAGLGGTEYLHYTINIYCKEGKARIVIDQIGNSLVGNKYTNANKINSLECQYYQKCNSSKKPRTGFDKMKKRQVVSIVSVTESWKKSLVKKAGGYSDF